MAGRSSNDRELERQAERRGERILRWFPPPVSSDKTADVGRAMLTASVVWFVSLVVIVVVIGVLVAALG